MMPQTGKAVKPTGAAEIDSVGTRLAGDRGRVRGRTSTQVWGLSSRLFVTVPASPYGLKFRFVFARRGVSTPFGLQSAQNCTHKARNLQHSKKRCPLFSDTSALRSHDFSFLGMSRVPLSAGPFGFLLCSELGCGWSRQNIPIKTTIIGYHTPERLSSEKCGKGAGNVLGVGHGFRSGLGARWQVLV